MIKFAVMINGKSHFRGMIPGTVLQESAEAMARGLPVITNRIHGRTVRKTIFVRTPDLVLVNFVL